MIAAKPNNRELKRGRILAAALKLFARKGFEAAALEEVARNARLAKGTLYLYFKDKEDLYAQVVLDVLDRLEAFIAECLLSTQGAVDKLQGVARGHILFFTGNRDYFRLFSSLLTTEAPLVHRRLMSPLLEKRRRLEAFVHELVEEGKREGTIRADLGTPDIAHSFIGMINQSVGRLCWDNELPVDAEQSAAAVMTILLTGVSSR